MPYEIEATISNRSISVQINTALTTGSIGSVRCSFSFDAEWNGLTKTVIFKGVNGKTFPILLTDTICTVPNEVLTAGAFFNLGVMGAQDATLVIVTGWAAASLLPGCYTAISPPTEDIYLQILSAFDEFSPKISVEDIEGGHRITITDVSGTKTFDVMDGVDGVPGPGEIGDENFATDDEVVEVLNDIFGSDAVNE